MQVFVLFADCVAGVDFGDVVVACCDGLTTQSDEMWEEVKVNAYLLQLRLLGLFIFAGFGSLAVQLLCCELRVMRVSMRRMKVEEPVVVVADDGPSS